MKFTRRKFLRFVPASVGAFAMGAIVLPKTTSPKYKVTEEMIIAAQRLTDPPLQDFYAGDWVDKLDEAKVNING